MLVRSLRLPPQQMRRYAITKKKAFTLALVKKIQFFCLFVPGQNKTRNNVLDRTVTFFFAKKNRNHD